MRNCYTSGVGDFTFPARATNARYRLAVALMMSSSLRKPTLPYAMTCSTAQSLSQRRSIRVRLVNVQRKASEKDFMHAILPCPAPLPKMLLLEGTVPASLVFDRDTHERPTTR